MLNKIFESESKSISKLQVTDMLIKCALLLDNILICLNNNVILV